MKGRKMKMRRGTMLGAAGFIGEAVHRGCTVQKVENGFIVQLMMLVDREVVRRIPDPRRPEGYVEKKSTRTDLMPAAYVEPDMARVGARLAWYFGLDRADMKIPASDFDQPEVDDFDCISGYAPVSVASSPL